MDLLFSSMLNNSVVPELELLMSRCSPSHQGLYRAILGVIVNQTNPICHQPAMNNVRPLPTCQVDQAFACYLGVFPYLSGVNAPQDKLCR